MSETTAEKAPVDPLIEQLAKSIALLSVLKFAPVAPPEQIAKAWLIVLRPKSITPEEMKTVAGILLSAKKEFPAPAEVLEALLELRDRRRLDGVASLMPCLDEAGREIVALPERVRGGRLLPKGDFSGDGSPGPKILAPVPTDEVRARMHEMLGWEVPRA